MLIAQDNPFGKITKEGPLFFLFGGGESGRGDYTPVNRDPKQTLVCGGGGGKRRESNGAESIHRADWRIKGRLFFPGGGT